MFLLESFQRLQEDLHENSFNSTRDCTLNQPLAVGRSMCGSLPLGFKYVF